MFWVAFSGILLLVAWVIWVLYIINPERQATVSIILKVEQAESWLDSFLRTVCHLFSQVDHLLLLEIWILTSKETAAVQHIVQRWQRRHPAIYLQTQLPPTANSMIQARGQVLWYFDMVKQNTPMTALRVLEQLLLPTGSASSGSIDLEKVPHKIW